MERQEEQRREQERRDYEYAQFLRRQEEEQRRVAQELARATAAASSAHPAASSSAIAATARSPYGDLGPIARRLLEAMAVGEPQLDIKYFTPPTPDQRLARQGIVPQPPNYFATTPFRLPEDAMADAPPAALPVKRRSESEPEREISPKGKARTDEPESDSPKGATSPVKKTITKQDMVKDLEDGISDVLLSYSVDALKRKIPKRFPDTTQVKRS